MKRDKASLSRRDEMRREEKRVAEQTTPRKQRSRRYLRYSRLLIVGCTLSAPVALLPYRAFSRAHALHSSISLVPSTRTLHPPYRWHPRPSQPRVSIFVPGKARITSAGGREEQASDNQARLSRVRGSELSALFAAILRHVDFTHDRPTTSLLKRRGRWQWWNTYLKAPDEGYANMRISLTMKAMKVRRDVFCCSVTRHR